MKISKNELSKIIREELQNEQELAELFGLGNKVRAAGEAGLEKMRSFRDKFRKPQQPAAGQADTAPPKQVVQTTKFTQGPSDSPAPTMPVQQTANTEEPKKPNINFLKPEFDDPKQLKFQFTQMVKDRARKDYSLKNLKIEIDQLKQQIENKKTQVNNLRNQLEDSGVDTGALEETASKKKKSKSTTDDTVQSTTPNVSVEEPVKKPTPTLKDLNIASKDLNRTIMDLKAKEQQVKELETQINDSTAKINNFRDKLQKLNIEVDLEEQNVSLQESKEVNRWKKLAGLIKG